METAASMSVDKAKTKPFPWPRVVVGLATLVTIVFLYFTPPGLLTKADAVAYAVCHRIAGHSFFIAGRQLPLCQRCTGTFIGALLGFFGQIVVLRRRRTAEFPPPLVIGALLLFTGLWAGDGFNSYLNMIGGPYLYEPQPWLRLITGALNGLMMTGLVFPVFNFTLWREPSMERSIRGLKELGLLVLLELAFAGIVLTKWDGLLYPLGILSALGVMTLLSTVNTMIIVMVVGRENAVDTWQEALIPLLAGYTLSVIQVGVIGLVRYAFTGTLGGFLPM